MGRKSGISIDYSVFEDLVRELEDLNGDIKKVLTDVMEQEGETVGEDTIDALADANLPAKGIYSKGTTKSQVLTHPRVEWSGSLAEIGLGFDKTLPGAGGWLITGTPKMQPDQKLVSIFGRKSYERKLQKDMLEAIQSEIDDRLRRFR